jgi:HAMP domain-containing protein
VLCALVPTGVALSVVYIQADGRLATERRERVREQSKLAAEQVVMRIRVIEREFARTVRRIETTDPADWEEVADSATSQLAGLAAEAGLGDVVRIFGHPPEPPPLTELVRDRLEDGHSVLATVPQETGLSRVILIHQAHLEDGPILMWGELDRERLQAETASFSADTETCLLDHRRVPIFCDMELPESLLPGIGELRTSAQDAYLTWDDGDFRRVGAHALVFVSFDYAAPPWMIVAGERRASVLSQLSEFRLTAILAGGLGLASVILLGGIQIRRSLEPLRRLTEGTQRVSEGNFAARVDIDSRDEFTDLANSFNDMTQQLERQFETLLMLREIDRAVLDTPKLEQVASTALRKVSCMTGCTVASLLVKRALDEGSDDAVAFVYVEGEEELERIEDAHLGSRDEQIIADAGLAVRSDEASLSCLDLGPLADRDEEFLSIGIEGRGELHGLLTLGFPPEEGKMETCLGEACQLADQLAMALATVHLVSDLDQLSVGALQALARSADAKSSWTVGHSERVARLSQALGEELGVSAKERSQLYRGGSLHDIGMLGVGEEILNWPGKLNDEQWEEIQRHPDFGVEILGPIPVFKDILGIVRYHHEKWDGTGYPAGLAGEDIPLLARIVAVADVYDALTSDRPYRAGMPPEKARQIIEEGSGSHFDATIVPVLQGALARVDETETEAPVRLIAVGE